MTEADLTEFAFHMDPQSEQLRDGSWTVKYPRADWSVSGLSEDDAMQKLRDEFIRRQSAGDDPLAYTDQVYREHLRSPIPGVYAMENDLYLEVKDRGYDEIQRVFREAERRRALGQNYTKDDYLREQSAG